MRTTVTLDDDVSAKLRGEIRRSGQSFKDTVNQLLRLGFQYREQLPSKRVFRVAARDLGLRPGFQLDNIGELLERLEGAEKL